MIFAMGIGTEFPTRKQIRLRNFHYSGGCAYSVTLCTWKRRRHFGVCESASVTLSEIGRIVCDKWLETARLRPDVVLDEFQIMPDHFHGILHLASRSAASAAATRGELFAIIRGFKASVTRAVRTLLNDPQFKVWQPRFRDRIIRSDRELEATRAYIRANPARWFWRPYEGL
jgi:REP element-mobilizing transposase RayT